MPKSLKERFWEKVDIQGPEDCWLWLASTRLCDKWRYGQFSFEGYPEFAHRVSWILTHGSIPSGLQICHKCDITLCVNPNHLFLGTQADNIRDMINKQRDALIGERNPASRLTDETVRLAKKLRNKGRTFSYIANYFGVARSTVTEAVMGITWKHI